MMDLKIIDAERRHIGITLQFPAEMVINSIIAHLENEVEEEIMELVSSAPDFSNWPVSDIHNRVAAQLGFDIESEEMGAVKERMDAEFQKQVLKASDAARAKYFEGILADVTWMVPCFVLHLKPHIGMVQFEGDSAETSVFVLAPAAGINEWVVLSPPVRADLKAWMAEHYGHRVLVDESIDRALRAIYVMGLFPTSEEDYEGFEGAARELWQRREDERKAD